MPTKQSMPAYLNALELGKLVKIAATNWGCSLSAVIKPMIKEENIEGG
jgi:hypothetical protein